MAQNFSPDDYPDRMSDADAVLLHVEEDPMFRSTILAVSILDRAPDRERLEHTLERLTRVVPRFRQRVVPDQLGLAAPRWEVDPHFDLRYHLRFVSIAGKGTVEDVLALAEPIAMQAFDPARPLWEWTIVEGLEHGGAALIGKVHHSITDGIAGVNMAFELFDLERDAPPREMPEHHDAPPPARWFDGAGHEARRAVHLPGGVTRLALRAVGSLARDTPGSLVRLGATARSLSRAAGATAMSDVMVERSLSLRYGELELPLDDFKRAAKATGVKINDVFIAALASGMEEYHRRHESLTESLRVSVMVNQRTESHNPTGNAFAPAEVIVPLGPADADQVVAVRALVQEAIGDPLMTVSRHMMSVMRRVPRPLVPRMIGSARRGIDVISSNVPGWPMTVYLAGARVDRAIPLAPTVGAAVNITIMSHVDRMNVGITVDPAAVVDRDVLLSCLRYGFDEALALGSG